MVNFDEIFERIKAATNTRTQVELAEVLDIRQSSISDAKRRNSVPSDWYMKLFEQFGLSPDWLKKGSGPMYLRTEQGYVPADASAGMAACEESGRYGGQDAKNITVAVYSANLPENGENTPVGRLSIPLSFSGPAIQVYRVEGTGMEPYILKNAFVGIDSAHAHVASGELYGVRLPYEGLVIKRAFVDTQNNKLILRSENPSHPEVLLNLEGHEQQILGRVAWVMQRL